MDNTGRPGRIGGIYFPGSPIRRPRPGPKGGRW